MEATSKRWRQVTPSQWAWEETALEALRSLLPDSDPYHGWTNFEFTDGGRINEVDALVVTPKGVFLVEVKSWSGRVTGDQGTWVQHRRDGSRESYANVASANTAKARSLSGLIKRNWRVGPDGPPPPWIHSLVWFSHPEVTVALPPELWSHLAVADGNTHTRNVQTLSAAIDDLGAPVPGGGRLVRVTPDQADRFAATMERVGFKQATRQRTAGSYVLQLPAFAERGATQDFLATHKALGHPARVRIWSSPLDATTDDVKALRAAALREYRAAQHPPAAGVVQALDLDDTEFGPAVVFDHHPRAVRLDRFLAERPEDLDLAARLGILADLAATVRDMHGKGLTHGMLTPGSVWLVPRTARPATTPSVRWEVRLSDLSLAARDGPPATVTTTRVGTLPAVQVGGLEVLLGSPAMETYLAPELFTDPGADGAARDVFSLGALTYLLVAGRPPAEDRDDLRNVLGPAGLSLSAVVEGVDDRLDDLVRRCTTPIVADRLARAGEVADRLALARSALAGDGTGADGPTDALEADAGAVLDGRFTVRRPLGRGSTARALWCQDDRFDRDVVLKVGRDDEAGERLAAEAAALADVRHNRIVECFEQVDVGGRPALVLSFAGERSLAAYLRDEGAVSTEFLRRWGEDLLEAVRYLEKSGVAHRDIKPDNLGMVEAGPHKRSHLVLFDFSLADTPSDDLRAGTPPYLDPFLADDGRGRFDLAAERYAAAVTIHQMATGETPVWGDGQSDPAYLPAGVEATVLAEAVDPEVRAPVAAFLARALRRRVDERFDTADDMARAWLDAFAAWDAADHEADDEPAAPVADGADRGPAPVALPDDLALDDPVSSLPTTKKVRSALRKLGADTVRGVAGLDAVAVNQARGVSVKSRKVVLRVRAAVLDRFADELARATTQPAGAGRGATAATVDDVVVVVDDDGTGTDPGPVPVDVVVGDVVVEVGAGATTGPAPAGPAPVGPGLRPDLDRLALQLVPPRPKRGRPGAVPDTVRALLGLPVPGRTPAPPGGDGGAPQGDDGLVAAGGAPGPDDVGGPAGAPPPEDWPTLAAVARLMGLGVGTVSQTLGKARARWSTSAELQGVAVDLGEVLEQLGGVAGVSELAGPLLDRRGSGREPAEALRLAAAVVRAVLDSGGAAADAFTLRRVGRRTLVVLASEPADGDGPDDGRRPTTVDPVGALDRAAALGARADELVAGTAVVPAGDVVPALRAVAAGAATALSDHRLVRLAAAASQRAVANAASDLVAVDVAPVDALRWSRPALVGPAALRPDELAARVAARFPAVALPDRPALDDAVAAAGLPLAWSGPDGAYRPTASGPGGVGALTLATGRRATVVSRGGTTLPPAEPTDPKVAEALAIDERLERSVAQGGFLALRVPTDRLAAARSGLARHQARPPGLATVDLEATFLAHLRATASGRGIAWDNLERADDRHGPDWSRLTIAAEAALDATVDELAGHERAVAWFPGVLVRHAPPPPRPAPLDRLRDLVGGDHPLRTLWLVVLGDRANPRPTVDGTPVPALAASQWLTLTDTWLDNDHRATPGRTA